ncbi:alkylhydroperoxidase domain protein, Avi_7169 family [Microbacterium azadirachtae]|uniref:Alkylhydroperoxidase domain protein, Avi_7169 family n=1 Tax=Microbacterium azadirachtae TaxID=582680 RepID=A0A1I6HSH0_9MICO|nr:alkylhydroperoxidase domain protein [Microbacterium azadirachtae]SFR57396.1 alkylhydroperoxidase domain protein, Avi_7169 family [Microbacterium azadirachtae]
MAEQVLRHPDVTPPHVFTQEELGWVPWLEPKPEAELTDDDYIALVDRSRAASPYFRLLVRDPVVLGARTRADNDIFYNTDAGLGRAEREISAAAASRVNGCLFCASVHSRFATIQAPSRRDDVQRLLDEGIDGEQDERWTAIIEAAAALTATPSRFGEAHVQALRAAGLDDQAIVDVVQSAAFFNWANRLMLSLGEPTPPTPKA